MQNNIDGDNLLNSSSQALSRRNWRRLRNILPTSIWTFLYSIREKLHARILMRSVLNTIYLSGTGGNLFELAASWESPNQKEILEGGLISAWRSCSAVGKELAGYHIIYAPLLAQIRATPSARILEIGIYKGGSHRSWRDLTVDCEVSGIDIDEATLVNEDRIKSAVGDQIQIESLMNAVKNLGGGTYDLIIDDGWHQPEAGLKSLQVLLPLLRSGGWYVLEDIDIQLYGPLWRRFSERIHFPYLAQIVTPNEIPQMRGSGYQVLMIRRIT